MIIGLTGGIATGKSTVSRLLKEKGIEVIDADVAAREVVNPGQAALEQIVRVFGSGVLQEDGTLDRASLGKLVFNDARLRQQLNEIVHPAVRAWMMKEKKRALQAGKKTIVLDIPLLFESGLEWMSDRTLLVYTRPSVQLDRLKKRNGYTTEEAQSRIAAQMPIEQKKAWADDVIDNNGTVEATKQQLEEWMARLNITV